MIDIAKEAATKAGNLAYSYFKKPIKVSYKADGSPVTPADIAAERVFREIIAKKFPDHGIIGEEFGSSKPNAKYQWAIDPIDGTKDYIRGVPFWATLVAVLEDKKPIIGVAYFPIHNELFAAEKNKGTFLNGKKVKVSNVKKLDKAYLSHDSVSHFARINKANNLIEITKIAQTKRGFSTFGLSLLLKGNIDIKLDPHGAIHDFAAPSILTEEAGGKFSDFSGKKSLTSDNALYTNGYLHDEVLRLLNTK
jgi:histidinol-phosphatase